MRLIEKIKTIFLNPDNFFKKVQKEKPVESIKFLIFLSIISGILAGAFLSFGQSPSSMFTAAFVLMMPVLMFFSYLFNTVTTQLFVMVFGGNADITQTMKSVIYSSLPATIFAWIPIIGIVASIYSLYINILGLSRYHKISRVRALFAIIVPGLLMAFVMLSMAFVFSLFLMSTTPLI